MKPYLYLFAGLVFGGVGAGLFVKSLPSAPGSEAERVQVLTRELQLAQRQVAELQALPGMKDLLEKRKPKFNSQIESMLADLKAGRPVDIDDVYQAFKEHMKDISPVFGLLSKQSNRKQAERMAGEFGRKYDLSPQQQTELQQELNERIEQRRREAERIMFDDKTRFTDLARLMEASESEFGIDPVVEGFLAGDKLAAFKQERLTKKAERVQREADGRLNRLSQVLKKEPLSATQQDQVFSLMARSSKSYDPTMQFEGVSADSASIPSTENREAAILDILSPSQKSEYDDYVAQKRQAAEADLKEIGLKLPANWDPWDFR